MDAPDLTTTDLLDRIEALEAALRRRHRRRPSRPSRRTAVLGAVSAGLLAVAGTTAALATVPSSTTGAITGCVNKTTAAVRIIDYQAGKRCTSNETTVNWSKGYSYKGAYSATVDYNVLDVVTSDGSSYVAKANPAVGTAPTNTTYWGLVASKGATGPAGPAGPKGATGATGPQGAPGTSVTSTTEPAGANCPNGGSKFVSASGTTYACNGTNGANGGIPDTCQTAGYQYGLPLYSDATGTWSCRPTAKYQQCAAGYMWGIDNTTGNPLCQIPYGTATCPNWKYQYGFNANGTLKCDLPGRAGQAFGGLNVGDTGAIVAQKTFPAGTWVFMVDGGASMPGHTGVPAGYAYCGLQEGGHTVDSTLIYSQSYGRLGYALSGIATLSADTAVQVYCSDSQGDYEYFTAQLTGFEVGHDIG